MQQYYFSFLTKNTSSISEDNYIISECNQYAYNIIINVWPNWSCNGILLCGKSNRCGKSHLANIWAKKTTAIRVTADNIQYILENFNKIFSKKQTILVDSILDMMEKQKLLFHLYNYATEANIQSLWLMDKKEDIDLISILDLRSRMRLFDLLEIHNPDDYMIRAMLQKCLKGFGIDVSHKIIEYISRRIERSFEEIENISSKINHLVSISGHNPSLDDISKLL